MVDAHLPLIGLDHVLTHIDYLWTGDPRTNTLLEYAFEWKDGKLYLYTVTAIGAPENIHPPGAPR